jgi:ribosomal protein L44E
MGNRNPERDAPYIGADTAVRELAKHYRRWALEVSCSRCIYWTHFWPRYLVQKYGEQITVGELARRFRCSHCGAREARVRARYAGDWR